MGYLNLVSIMQNSYRQAFLRAWLDGFAENDAWLKDNGWATNTKATFYLAAAPTGWTKDASQNDRLLRVVSGPGLGDGFGGSASPASAISLAHSAHSISTQGLHNHDLAHTHYLAPTSTPGTFGGSTNYLRVDDNGFLRFWLVTNNFPDPSYTSINNRLALDATLTSGDDGVHAHGAATQGTALSDITLAYADVIVCSKDSSTGYTDLTSEAEHDLKIDFNPFDALADNDVFNNTRLTPADAIMPWYQAAAPQGWEKTVDLNGRALRLVSGAGGSTGGTFDPATNLSLVHSHTVASDAGHTHTIANHTHTLNNSAGTTHGSWSDSAANYVQANANGMLVASAVSGPSASHTAYKAQTNSDGASNTGASGTHVHTVGNGGGSIALAYCDVILCKKLSTGAPYDLVDLTSEFSLKKLISRQRLTKLAQNDEHIKYHTVPSASDTYFRQTAAPLTWTKQTTQDDKLLRVVSGAGGVMGGSQALSATITLAHTHTLDNRTHNHAIGSHIHRLSSAAATANAEATNGFGIAQDNYTLVMLGSTGSNQNKILRDTVATGANSDSKSHNHGGTTGSQLANIALKYADVILCRKD
jgi:hypothetical protein